MKNSYLANITAYKLHESLQNLTIVCKSNKALKLNKEFHVKKEAEMWCVISEVAEANIYMYLRTCHFWFDSRNCFQMVQTLRSLHKLNFLSQVTKGMLVLLDSMDGMEIQVSVMFLICVGETIIMLKTKKTKQCSLCLNFFTINMFMKSMDIFLFLFESFTLLISSGSGWPNMTLKRELAYIIFAICFKWFSWKQLFLVSASLYTETNSKTVISTEIQMKKLPIIAMSFTPSTMLN